MQNLSWPLLAPILISLIPLPSEAPHAPVPTTHVPWIEIIQIPPQTPKPVLARLHEQVHFPSPFLLDPVDVALHVEVRVPGADDRNFGCKELRERARPLVRGGRVSKPRVEEHEGVEVWIVGHEFAGFVQRVEVIDVGRDLHLTAQPVFYYGAERVSGLARWERELGVAVRHAFGSDEDEVEGGAGEEVRELDPDLAGKRGFCARAENEQTHGWGIWAQAFDIRTCACEGWMEGIA